jgi:hypothetical protein
VVGLALIACIAGLTTYTVIHLAWRWRTNQRWRNRRGIVRHAKAPAGPEA